jgi:hypothetical protein
MHTYRLKAEGFDEALVSTNSDWSGEAIIRWKTAGATEYQEARLPGEIIEGLAKRFAFDRVEDRVRNAVEKALLELESERLWGQQEADEKSCPHNHEIEKLGDDGCVHCGFYTK